MPHKTVHLVEIVCALLQYSASSKLLMINKDAGTRYQLNIPTYIFTNTWAFCS